MYSCCLYVSVELKFMKVISFVFDSVGGDDQRFCPHHKHDDNFNHTLCKYTEVQKLVHV